MLSRSSAAVNGRNSVLPGWFARWSNNSFRDPN
jgi:hypothetical protein